jgi:hypothetical protein
MQNLQQRVAELSQDVDRLIAVDTRSEARLQALERRRRRFPWLTIGVAMLAFILGHFSAAPQSARAEASASSLVRAEQAVVEKAKTGIEDVVALERKEQQRFHSIMEGARRDLNRAKDTGFDAGIAVAVILHDMKRMLEAVPRMADDMHRMTGDMHEMNQKMSAVPAMAAEMNVMNRQMGVMSRGVDSTMGRMGRMMPWTP